MTEMSLERRQVVAAMISLGWTAHRNSGGLWEFRKTDSDGYYVSVKVSQKGLSWAWIMKHDERFQEIVRELWKEVYPTLFRHIIERTPKE